MQKVRIYINDTRNSLLGLKLFSSFVIKSGLNRDIFNFCNSPYFFICSKFEHLDKVTFKMSCDVLP